MQLTCKRCSKAKLSTEFGVYYVDGKKWGFSTICKQCATEKAQDPAKWRKRGRKTKVQRGDAGV